MFGASHRLYTRLYEAQRVTTVGMALDREGARRRGYEIVYDTGVVQRVMRGHRESFRPLARLLDPAKVLSINEYDAELEWTYPPAPLVPMDASHMCQPPGPETHT